MKPSNTHKLTSDLVVARWRFYLVLLVLLSVVLALLWHLARLQVLPGEERGFEFLQGQGDARTVRSETLAANRGVITDRNGQPLAVSTPVTSLWANPKLLAKALQEKSVRHALASQLDVKPQALLEKVERYRNKEFMYLRRHLPPQEATKILEHKWQGVYGRTEYQRYYPAGEVAAHWLVLPISMSVVAKAWSWPLSTICRGSRVFSRS